MNSERLFQFIWQYQYFNKTSLHTTAGEDVEIMAAGQLNVNQGPDFVNARIRIGSTIWAGAVELHLKTSDWDKHRHQFDSNYSNVVLHVVWDDDKKTNELPVLELKERISKLLLGRYEELMNSSAFVPCENSLHKVNPLTWQSWKDRLLAERLLRRSTTILSWLQQSNDHWEEVFWWMLARNFGMKVNADAFEAMARSIPLILLARNRSKIHSLEAILLGQAGLLEGNLHDDYAKLLQREYRFIQHKQHLRKISNPVFFLRMRPVNFPTVRLAQLAMLVSQSLHLFETIRKTKSLTELKDLFDVTANDYWHYHYRFDEESPFIKKNIGASMIDNLVINTIVPVLFAYGEYHDEPATKEKAIKWLESTEPESNVVLKNFTYAGIENNNAFDSQALLELKTQYCDHKRCLECGIGNQLLKS